jgi:CubicO group peptidase (beta-lactamase class C family)
MAVAFESRLLAALDDDKLEGAAKVLAKAAADGQVAAAVMCVTQRDMSFTRAFGKASLKDAMFLLGSITKPICLAGLMTLFDRGEFALDDPLKRFIPQFTGDGRDRVTMRHLLTHVSGLPDQVVDNSALRAKHAALSEFVEHAVRAPLAFSPGSRFQYSSMGTLLAMHVAERIGKVGIREFVDRTVFERLGMEQSALGLGKFMLDDVLPCQTEFGAPEAGGGDPAAKEWDWNSPYWRRLGAPWGGAHCSAPDVERFLAEFLFAKGNLVKPATARLMVSNQNAHGITPRGLGFNVGVAAGSRRCSEKTFGHTGSTGTVCWADPASETICVVLTTLPGRAVQPHPRDLAAERISAAVR